MFQNKKIIIAALISSQLDKEEFLRPVKKDLANNGNEIISEVIQRRGISRSKKRGGSKNTNAPLNSKTFMGTGKILELKNEVDEKKPDVVIFINELSNHQIEAIESIIACEVKVYQS